MSTVPKADAPAPADNHITHTVSDSMSSNYGRPTAGGAPVAGKPAGNPPPEPAAGPTPQYQISMTGAPVSTGGTQVGADVGHGATQLVGEPDATGAPESATDGGTVGYGKS